MLDRDTLRGYRTLIFHGLYGVPAAVLMLLDMFGTVDITPILKEFISVDKIPLVLSCIAAGSVVLRWLTTTRLGCSHTAPDEAV